MSTNIQDFAGDIQIRGTTFIKANSNTNNLAIGTEAGENNQGSQAVAVGLSAGKVTQGQAAVAVGRQSGVNNQGSQAIAVGYLAGQTDQGNLAIAVGYAAGQIGQACQAIAIGTEAGMTLQGENTVAIGTNAGQTSQGGGATAVGRNAGSTGQGTAAVAVGRTAGKTSQGEYAVAVGYLAGETSQGNNSVAVGYGAGLTGQGNQAIAVGRRAGETGQGAQAVAVGQQAGLTSQGNYSVAVGYQAGLTGQGGNSVAVGRQAGETDQGTQSVAMGYQAGQTSQENYAVAVGRLAGQTGQGSSAVAVGRDAGQTGQGNAAVAIGQQAGETNQHDNSIVINATGDALNTTATDRLFIKPIRSGTDGSTVLSYDDTTGEIIDSTNLATDSTRITAGTGIRFDGQSTETFNTGGGSGTNTRTFHMRFNNGRQLTLQWTDLSQFEFRWGGGGTHPVRASIGVSTVFGFTFTGQHRNFIKDVPYQDVINRQLGGLIVSANNNEYVKITGGAEKGSNAITQNEALPILSLSSKTLDKSCFGVISESEDPNTARSGSLGMFRSFYDTEDGDKRVIINSLGEGAIWVVNTNGSLESGDYITTSNVAGYGQKQDSEFLANYTVAKITMDCDFEPTTNPVQIIKKELSNVNYWVNTTYENVTNDQYLHLDEENRRTITETVYTNEYGETFTEQNEQSTYTELTRTVYQQIITEESKTEREGWSTEIRQETNNVLDEHGQIQWEDHPTETEKAYKIRYLDADGGMTDEANHVYKAAYVGCTYHCG
jgi:hypothetical protein